MKKEQGSSLLAFEAVRNGIDGDISAFRLQQQETAWKISEKIKLLADGAKDKIPPLIIINTNEIECDNLGNFTVYEYSPLRNAISVQSRHSQVLSFLSLDIDFDDKQERNSAGFYRQIVQFGKTYGAKDPIWIKFAERIVQELEESMQNENKDQVPTFSIECRGKTLIFPVIPLPEELKHTSHIYSEEIELMKQRGGKLADIYSAKPTLAR